MILANMIKFQPSYSHVYIITDVKSKLLLQILAEV